MWSDNLEKRSTLRLKKPPKFTRTASSSMGLVLGKQPSISLKGSIFNVDKSPFEDFPEVRLITFLFFLL